MSRRRRGDYDDDCVLNEDYPSRDFGSITQLIEYPRKRPVKRKGPRVRMGFHPPEKAYEEDE